MYANQGIYDGEYPGSQDLDGRRNDLAFGVKFVSSDHNAYETLHVHCARCIKSPSLLLYHSLPHRNPNILFSKSIQRLRMIFLCSSLLRITSLITLCTAHCSLAPQASHLTHYSCLLFLKGREKKSHVLLTFVFPNINFRHRFSESAPVFPCKAKANPILQKLHTTALMCKSLFLPMGI